MMIVPIYLFIMNLSYIVYTDFVDISSFEYQNRKSTVLNDIFLDVSFFDCVKECLNSRNCRSINYRQTLKLCELSQFDSQLYVSGESDRKGYVTTNMNKWKDEVGDCDPTECERDEKCVVRDGLLTCVKTGCGLPQSRQGAHPVEEILGLYSRTTYVCEEGYITTGNHISVCQVDGKWSVPDFNCKIQDCGIPENENNKEVNFTTTEYGSNATVRCQDKYKSDDPSTDQQLVTCQANGSWTASTLNCEWEGCPDIETIQLPACLTLLYSSGTYMQDYNLYKANSSSGQLSGPHLYVECQSNHTWEHWIEVTCTKGIDCEEIKPSFPISGAFTIEINSQRSTLVYCDMAFMTGGWTIVQRREKGIISFKRNWNDYKHGFGNVNHDYWIGNDNLHEMTSSGTKHVVFLMEDKNGNERYTEYTIFKVGSESENYVLTIGGAINVYGYAGDPLTGTANGMNFSTVDRDLDLAGWNCAGSFNGGWWYRACHLANPNGVLGSDSPGGMVWGTWRGIHYSMARFVIMIKD